jgi:hypothetical protein
VRKPSSKLGGFDKGAYPRNISQHGGNNLSHPIAQASWLFLEGGATRPHVHFNPRWCASRARYADLERPGQIGGALILSAAADAGCSLLLSEDSLAGFTWRGVRVVDPFAKTMGARLKRVIGD